MIQVVLAVILLGALLVALGIAYSLVPVEEEE